jgi:hypothetical protein
LLFVAINADIGRQFELIQQSWINNSKFNGLQDEKDPIVSDNDGNGTMAIQATPVRRRIHGLRVSSPYAGRLLFPAWD